MNYKRIQLTMPTFIIETERVQLLMFFLCLFWMKDEKKKKNAQNNLNISFANELKNIRNVLFCVFARRIDATSSRIH